VFEDESERCPGFRRHRGADLYQAVGAQSEVWDQLKPADQETAIRELVEDRVLPLLFRRHD